MALSKGKDAYYVYFAYLLQCCGGSICAGIATDVARRFGGHRNKKGGHYTASREAEKIIHTEKFATKSAALKREAEIKKWKRQKKLVLAKAEKAVQT